MDALSFQSAYTVDSLGLPSLSNESHDPVARRGRAVFRETLRRDPAGQATQDRYSQARLGYRNHVYLAINTLMDWMGSAVFSIQSKAQPKDAPLQKSLLRKSIGAASSDSSEWHPVEDEHEAAKLFANPNASQTLGDYLAYRVMCRALFGQSIEWIVPTVAGKPCEMYVMLPQYSMYQPPTMEYPAGYWRFFVPQQIGMLSAGNYPVVDARHVLQHRMPNPIDPFDGYSPLTAGAQMLDVLTSVIESRKNAMDNGFSPDIVLGLAGAGQSERERVQALMGQSYTGVGRGQKILVTNSGEINVQELSTTPDKMDFGGTYKDAINFVMALFGVPPALAGLTETTSFSGLYAAVKQFTTGKLGSECRKTAEFWSKKLIQPAWPGCKAVLEIPAIEDDTQKLAQLNTLAASNAVTINELRAAANMKPMEGADVPPAQWNQQFAPAPQPGVPGAPNQPPPVVDGSTGEAGGGLGEDGGEDAYPHALMQHVLGAFGVDAGQQEEEPAEDPNAAAMIQKSLGMVFRKSVDATGHKHKDKGPGGGQFGSGGSGKTASEDRPNDLLDEAFDPKPKSGTPVKIPSTPAMDASGDFDATKTLDTPKPGATGKQGRFRTEQDGTRTSLPDKVADKNGFYGKDGPNPDKPATQADAHPAKAQAQKAADALDPATIPVAKMAVPVLRKAPPPQTPLAKQQAANPQDWLPKMLTTYLPIFAAAMALGKGPASKLLIFGAMAALHGLSKRPEEAEPQEDAPLRPGDAQKRPSPDKLVPTALPAKKPPVATPQTAKAGTPKAQPFTPPKNAAGKGSLPGRIGKSLGSRTEVADYFARMLEEECGAI